MKVLRGYAPRRLLGVILFLIAGLAALSADGALAADDQVGSGTNRSQGNLQTGADGQQPLLIEGEDGTVIDGVRISSDVGDCIIIRDSTNVRIQNSVIGPCAGRGVLIEAGSGIAVVGNRIQTQFSPSECCDRGNGVLAVRTDELLIDANYIAYSESNIQLLGVTNGTITNNTLANPLGPFPRGQQIQVAGGLGQPESSTVLIEGNRLVSSKDSAFDFEENQEDAINVYRSRDVTVRNNDIRGGSSVSGCGILVDDGATGAVISSNRIYNTGQCGIGVANGQGHVVEENRVLLTEPIEGAGNVAIYVWNQYADPCADVIVRNNVATFRADDGSHNSFFDGGGCAPVTLSNNTLDDEAYALLRAEFDDDPARLIPELSALKRPGGGIAADLELKLLAIALAFVATGVVLLGLRRRKKV